MQLTDTGIDYVAGGRRFPIFNGGGMTYIYDPRHQLKAERAAVAKFLSPPARGLGVNTTDTAIQAAATAANFIPVVGPIISSVLSIGDALFGGGDPTALSILINQVVQLRAQIASLNNMLGQPDSFVIPAGFNAQDKDTWRDFVDAIIEQTLGTTESDIQSNRRPDYYSAIAALQKIVTAMQGQVHDQQLTAAIEAAIEPTLVMAPAAAAAAAGSAASDTAPAPAGGSVDDTAPSTAAAAEIIAGVPNWALLAVGLVGVIVIARA